MNILYYLAFLLLFHPIAIGFLVPPNSPLPDSQYQQKMDKEGGAKIVLKSTDGGQTWQDISEGLPENLEAGGFIVNETGLYLRAGNRTYHSKPNSTTPFWKKEISPDKWGSIATGKSGLFEYHYRGEILQNINGTNVWSPMYTNFQGTVRTVFETAGGTMFVGSDRGLYKSSNSGKTWKYVQSGGWVMKLLESDGVQVATSMTGIIKPEDMPEDKPLSQVNTPDFARHHIYTGLRVQAFIVPVDKPLSQDYPPDSIWNPISISLPDQALISSIVQVGKYFFCGHPTGILRSTDNGKTWQLILPSIEKKVFNLSVSGNVIYAVHISGGC